MSQLTLTGAWLHSLSGTGDSVVSTANRVVGDRRAEYRVNRSQRSGLVMEEAANSEERRYVPRLVAAVGGVEVAPVQSQQSRSPPAGVSRRRVSPASS
jgi:hypothetical protein